MKDFVACMLSDREPRVTGADGLKALAIAAAAEKSHLQGCSVKVVAEVASAVS
jgi:predicted dehydrogenase